MEDIKIMPDDEPGIPVDEEEGKVIERLKSGKFGIYEKDYNNNPNLKRLSR